ncbi:Protein of unknown function, partial [Gryllus bimaculatus]
ASMSRGLGLRCLICFCRLVPCTTFCHNALTNSHHSHLNPPTSTPLLPPPPSSSEMSGDTT